MDGQRFDRITRAMASGQSRRSVLKGMLGIGGAAAAGVASPTLADGRTIGSRPTIPRPTTTPPEPTCDPGFSFCGPECCPDGQCAGDLCCEQGTVRCLSGCCDNDAVCCDLDGCCHGDCTAVGHCCATGSMVCGPECCTPDDQCCDGECCPGVCYGEELCCLRQNWCESTGECCAAGTECCGASGCVLVADCCDGTPFDPSTHFCCGGTTIVAGECCPLGGCETGVTCCPSGVCVDLRVEGNCCDNSHCSAANLCQAEFCQDGVCVAGEPVQCPEPTDQCHVAGSCDPETGQCSDSRAPHGTPCADGNPACIGGACCTIGHEPINGGCFETNELSDFACNDACQGLFSNVEGSTQTWGICATTNQFFSCQQFGNAQCPIGMACVEPPNREFCIQPC